MNESHAVRPALHSGAIGRKCRKDLRHPLRIQPWSQAGPRVTKLPGCSMHRTSWSLTTFGHDRCSQMKLAYVHAYIYIIYTYTYTFSYYALPFLCNLNILEPGSYLPSTRNASMCSLHLVLLWWNFTYADRRSCNFIQPLYSGMIGTSSWSMPNRTWIFCDIQGRLCNNKLWYVLPKRALNSRPRGKIQHLPSCHLLAPCGSSWETSEILFQLTATTKLVIHPYKIHIS